MSRIRKYSYPVKDKDIRIFKEIKTKTIFVKEYIHKEGTSLKAYVRQLSSNEQYSLEAVQNAVSVEFVINYREIDVDMFIEFKGKTYAIDSTDGLEFYNTEIKLRGYIIKPPTYDEIRWKE